MLELPHYVRAIQQIEIVNFNAKLTVQRTAKEKQLDNWQFNVNTSQQNQRRSQPRQRPRQRQQQRQQQQLPLRQLCKQSPASVESVKTCVSGSSEQLLRDLKRKKRTHTDTVCLLYYSPALDLGGEALRPQLQARVKSVKICLQEVKK